MKLLLTGFCLAQSVLGMCSSLENLSLDELIRQHQQASLERHGQGKGPSEAIAPYIEFNDDGDPRCDRENQDPIAE